MTSYFIVDCMDMHVFIFLRIARNCSRSDAGRSAHEECYGEVQAGDSTYLRMARTDGRKGRDHICPILSVTPIITSAIVFCMPPYTVYGSTYIILSLSDDQIYPISSSRNCWNLRPSNGGKGTSLPVSIFSITLGRSLLWTFIVIISSVSMKLQAHGIVDA